MMQSSVKLILQDLGLGTENVVEEGCSFSLTIFYLFSASPNDNIFFSLLKDSR